MLSFYLSGIRKILAIAKKVFIVIAVYFIVISLFMHFINKDKPKVAIDPIKKNREEIYKVINDPKLNKTQEGKISTALYKAVMCGMIGEACSNNPSDGNNNFNKSIFGFMANLIALPYINPPASGIYWAYSGLQNAGFIPKSYAAEGTGFAAMKPISNLWIVFRDIAYMLLVLVLITIGFMIMFQMKLNPQTVISVENALPRIVISLLLITFSFAIAGFLIDLMYVLIVLSISILSKNTLVHIDVREYQNKILGGSGWFLFNKLSNIWDIGDALLSFIPLLIRIPASIIMSIILYILMTKTPIIGPLLTGEVVQNALQGGGFWKWLWSVVGTPLGIAFALFIGPIFGLAFFLSLLVWFTAVFLFFRIFFMLFRAYIEIILLVVFAPILLIFEAVPGRNVFSWWLKNLFGNIISFPLVVILLIVGNIIIESPSAGGSIWIPPLLPYIDHADFVILIGIGILFLIPDLVKMVKELMGIKGLPISVGLGTYFAGAGAAAGGALGLVGQYGTLSLALPGLRETVKKWVPRDAPLIGNLVHGPPP
ncbi:hypothetical protein HY612_00375 [Candidatus Roizmanbacteria bacterium]|nr:hypothetical protein [Candidatus Roizmanbacteria bacterium]